VERDHPKTASSRRRVSIDPRTVSTLVAHRERQQERLTACKGRLAKDAYLFSPEMDGSRPSRPTVVTHRFKRLTRRAGLDGLRLHDLRQFVATQLIAGGGARLPGVSITRIESQCDAEHVRRWVPARDQEAASLIGSLDLFVPSELTRVGHRGQRPHTAGQLPPRSVWGDTERAWCPGPR
jgi:integrase